MSAVFSYPNQSPVALPLLPEKKERCSLMGCRNVVVQECRHCTVTFCIKHKFPFEHSCQKRDASQQRHRDLLKGRITATPRPSRSQEDRSAGVH